MTGGASATSSSPAAPPGSSPRCGPARWRARSANSAAWVRGARRGERHERHHRSHSRRPGDLCPDQGHALDFQGDRGPDPHRRADLRLFLAQAPRRRGTPVNKVALFLVIAVAIATASFLLLAVLLLPALGLGGQWLTMIPGGISGGAIAILYCSMFRSS